MDNILLSREGVFPIIVDANGSEIESLATGLTEAGTIQGEGKLAGVPSLFVRLQGCNLRCIWNSANGFAICDTAHSSFQSDGGIRMSVDDVYKTVINNIGAMHHVVITGGEPLLQASSLALLCKKLKQNDIHITIETNGSIYSPLLNGLVDLYSISPKLLSSVPTVEKLTALNIEPSSATQKHNEIRVNIDAIQAMIDDAKQNDADVQLKFVVSEMVDADEIKLSFINRLNGLDQNDVLVMPLGTDSARMHHEQSVAVDIAVRNGWRYSPRLHIDIFGNKEGV